MAIDTPNKRSSAIHVGLPWRRSMPIPDGEVSTDDQYHFLGMYLGDDKASEEAEAAAASRVPISPLECIGFNWENGPIAPGWFMIVAPLPGVIRIRRDEPKQRELVFDKNHREDEVLALLIMLQN